MNNLIFEIVVGGILIVAWLHVLGRPVLSKISYLVRRMRSSDGGIGYVRPSVRSLGAGLLRPFFQPMRSWRRQTVFARRRQLLIALLLMVVVSAGLAIVLRGPFLILVPVVVLVLGLYLNTAVRIGGRLVRWQNHVRQSSQYRDMDVPVASDIGQLVESEIVDVVERDGTEKVDVASGLGDHVEHEVDEVVDPTLKVEGSRRRKRLATKNPSRRIVFRRPRLNSGRVAPEREGVASDWSHLDQAANDR